MAADQFSLVFVVALVLTTGLKIWLSTRQMRHVARHRAEVPAQFSGHVSLESHQKAADYTLARHRFGLLGIALEVLVLLGLTFFGGLQWLYDLSLGWFGRVPGAPASSLTPVFAALAFVVLTSLVSALIDLPFEWYRQFVIEEKFGFNRMTFFAWVKDGLIGAGIAAVLGVPLLGVVIWLMRSAGAFWWFWAWAVWVVFGLLVMLIYPVWIAPLLNKFEPLAEGETRNRVEALLTRCGFTSKGLFVMDGSKRSSHSNAYFTGLGNKKRIVFFDTLLSRLKDDEIEAVLAHELGHFKHKHVLKRMVLSFAFSFAGFAFLGWIMQQPWFYQGLGMTPFLGDAQGPALVLFMIALPAFLFPLHPLTSFFSRKDEFQADAFATRNAEPASLVSALVKLYNDNASTLTPDPVYSTFYDSHPPAMIRIQKLQESHALRHS